MIRPPPAWLSEGHPAAHGEPTTDPRGETVSRTFMRGKGFVAVGVLAMAAGSLTALPAASTDTGVQSTYVVLYSAGAKSTRAEQAVASAGGTLVANYSDIGVVIARSSQSGFAAAMGKAKGVESAVATGGFGVK